MKRIPLVLVASSLWLFALSSFAAPIPYSGKVAINGENFDGTAKFAFELREADGTVHWRNGTDANASIEVHVDRGHYVVLLGGQGMAPITPRLFLDEPELYLKVRFYRADTQEWLHLQPDQRITSTPHALSAEHARIADSITGSLPKSVVDASQKPYSVRTGIVDDQSAGIQAALDQAQTNGGGLVVLPAGTIYAKNLRLPYSVTLVGQGVDATILKLPNGANAFILSSSTYAQNQNWANLFGGVENLTFHGNNENNATGSLLVIKGYRFLARRCRFTHSSLHGILLSGISADGTTNQNGLAENRIVNCSFDRNEGAGIYAKDGVTRNVVADQMIYENDFNGNGSSGYYQIDLERSAGFHIVGNQMYAGKLGDLRAKAAGALLVRGNNFDGTSNEPIDGRVRQVVIEAGGWGTCVISGNLFHNHATEGGDWTMLDIGTTVSDSITVTGNVFNSLNIEATPWLVSGSGKDTVVFSGNAVQNGRSGTVIPSGSITRDMLDSPVQADLNRSSLPTSGAFTPTVAFQTMGDYAPVYIRQRGAYHKQGPIVHFNLHLFFNNNNYTTASGKFFISGLPHKVKFEEGDSFYQNPCSVGPYSNLDCTHNGNFQHPTLQAFAAPNKKEIYFRISKGVSGSGFTGTHAGFDTNAVESGQAEIEINLSGFYFTDE